MRLLAVKKFIHEQRSVPLLTLCKHFSASPEVMRDMLNKWINKGKIKREPPLAGCGSSCSKCNPLLMEIYTVVE
ncbi:MAG: FeoC-like transcriptional regulator [Legionellales bacterium]|nr:FeoC-like transcriptional regulator [Legionellales bacterium]